MNKNNAKKKRAHIWTKETANILMKNNTDDKLILLSVKTKQI
jgi:hypothetical protein